MFELFPKTRQQISILPEHDPDVGEYFRYQCEAERRRKS